MFLSVQCTPIWEAGGGLGLVVSLFWPMISMRCPFGVTAAGELSVSQPREVLLFQLQLTPTGKWPLKRVNSVEAEL